MENCNPVKIPLEPGIKFSKLSPGEECVNKSFYQQIIGCLTYAMTSTCRDLSAAVSLLSQYMSYPGKHHGSGVKRVLRYLKGTVNHGICYKKGNCEELLSGYSDASWGDCLDTRRSTS